MLISGSWDGVGWGGDNSNRVYGDATWSSLALHATLFDFHLHFHDLHLHFMLCCLIFTCTFMIFTCTSCYATWYLHDMFIDTSYIAWNIYPIKWLVRPLNPLPMRAAFKTLCQPSKTGWLRMGFPIHGLWSSPTYCIIANLIFDQPSSVLYPYTSTLKS